MKITTAVDVRNEQAVAVAKRLDNGYLRLYNGEQPASAEAKIRFKPLAELRFGSPAFKEPARGQIEAHPIMKDTNAARTGKASWYICTTEDGAGVWIGDVSGKDGDGSLKLDSVEIQAGAEVSVSSLTYSIPG